MTPLSGFYARLSCSSLGATLMLLPKGAIYFRTCKHDSVVKVLVIWYHSSMKKSRTTFPLEEKDREAIAAIREHYGVRSDLDAIRIALRELYRSIQQTGCGQQAFHPPHE